VEAVSGGFSPGIEVGADRRITPQVELVAAGPRPAAIPNPVRVARAEAAPVASPLRRANYVPADTPRSAPRIERVAMVERTVLGRGTLGDLIRTAAEEHRSRP
jgi:hypothetical protein